MGKIVLEIDDKYGPYLDDFRSVFVKDDGSEITNDSELIEAMIEVVDDLLDQDAEDFDDDLDLDEEK